MKKEDWQVPVFFIGLLMGTSSTLIIKAIYDAGAILDGKRVPYDKPIFMTFLMFASMAFALPVYMWLAKREQAAYVQVQNEFGGPREQDPLIGKNNNNSSSQRLDYDTAFTSQGDDFDGDYIDSNRGEAATAAVADDVSHPPLSQVLTWKLLAYLFIPSFFDMLGTTLSTLGLLYTSVSIYQLSRCSVIVVTAFFKLVILHHRLTPNMLTGVGINTFAMIIVGASALFFGNGDEQTNNTHDTITGLCLILASCVVQGAQYVFEEKVMSFDGVPPLVLVGVEGVNGLILSIFVAFPFALLCPGSDNGYYEDIFSAITLPFTSLKLFILLSSFVLVIFLYNIFCIYITFLLSSIYHCIMDNSRPVSVWVAGLILYYTFGVVGQPWGTGDWFQLLAMALMFFGTAVYGGQVQLPCLPPPDEDQLLQDDFPSIPIRDTPVFSARVVHSAANSDIDPAMLLVQSPLVTAQQTSNHHENAHHHGSDFIGLPPVQLSSRAQPQYGSL